MIGIGTDLVKIDRIQFILEDKPALNSFLKQTYTKKEMENIISTDSPIFRYATHFAAKEAIFKALSIDRNTRFAWSDIEILYNDTGAPYVILHNTIKKISHEKRVKSIHLSLSYDTDYAIAFVVIL